MMKLVRRIIMKEKLSEELIQRILRFQYIKGYKYIAENLFVFKWESDYLVKTVSGYWYEMEIKISFSDFKNDAKNKKEKFEILGKGEYYHRGQLFKEDKRPNYFSYCVTEDMVDKVLPLLPDYAGLYFIDEKHHHLVNVKAPQQIHKEKISDESLKLTEKFYYNYRSWKLSNERFSKEKKELKDTIKWLKNEYKAATGSDIYDAL